MAKYDPDEFFSAEKIKPPLMWTDEKIISTGFMTHSGPGGYEIHFRTPYRDKYLEVQRTCRKAIDHGKQESNADRIRAMSDEELAEYLSTMQAHAYYHGMYHGKMSDETEWLDWLQQEVDTNDN